MFKEWESTFNNLIKGKSKGFVASALRSVLWIFSWIYLLLIKLRKGMFDLGLKKSEKPIGPVIVSIGNIVAGGTGKTPATMLLAREFYPTTKIALLSRGYRSLAEKEEEPTILSRGDGPLHSALYCGDEPCILSDNFPKALSYVGKRRDIAAKWAAEAGAELLLIDDGMQHFQLQRDFDVVVMDTKDPFGQGHLLPRGTLRETPEGLKRASIVILNHAEDRDEFEQVKAAVRKYTDAPVVGTVYSVDKVIGFDGRAVDSIEGKNIGLFCSIAHPEYFEATVRGLKSNVVDRYSVPDHMLFDLHELKKFANRCIKNGAELLVCTEKDKVKLLGILTASIKIAWVRVRMKIVSGESEWNSFISSVKERICQK